MGYYADCYAIVKTRAKKLANSFLNNFLPGREERADVYEVPQYGTKTAFEFDNVSDLLTYLENNPTIPYSVN